MKKLFALVLSLMLVFAFAGSALAFEPIPADEIKVGFVYIGDPSDKGYTLAHHEGTLEMQEALGLRDDQILVKTFVTEDSACEDAILELIEQGCDMIFGNSFGFGTYMAELAEEYPDVIFLHCSSGKRAIWPASPRACAPRTITWAMWPPCRSPSASTP